MKSYYCRRLFEDLNFSVEKVYICSGLAKSIGFDIPNKNEKIGKYIKRLISWRKKIYNFALNNKIPEQCLGCKELQKTEISFLQYLKNLTKINNYKIKNIVVKSFRQCEYACVYCLEKGYTKGEKTTEIIQSKYYNFKPILEKLIHYNLIDHDVCIEFQGGSISVLDEFDELLNIINNFEVGKLIYHTNCYSYIPKISQLAKKVNSYISVSIDAGTSETYKKIKTVDSFDRVIQNIIKYANSNIQCNVKYILVRKCNDNIDEIKNYCELIKKIHSSVNNKKNISIMLEIDFRDSLREDFQIPQHYLEFFKYVISFSKDNGINFACQDFIREYLKRDNIVF